MSEQTSLHSNWLKNEVHNKDEGAAKAEDSEIPIHLWDNVLSHQLSIPLTTDHRLALVILRRWSIQLWKRRLSRSFTHWFRCSLCNGSYDCAACAKYLLKQHHHVLILPRCLEKQGLDQQAGLFLWFFFDFCLG